MENEETTFLTTERIVALKAHYGLTYQVEHALAAQIKVGLKGKRVLEAGGGLPADFVFDVLGTHQWIGIVQPDWRRKSSTDGSTFSTERADMDRLKRLANITAADELGRYEILAGAAEEIPRGLTGHFDVVFSSAAFEHFLNFPLSLDRLYRVLRPGGCLFTMFAPIWSAHDGHHLPPITDKSGVVMNFHSSPIPPWGHLLMRPPEMHRHLISSTDPETAQVILYAIYHSPEINRLFTEDYMKFFQNSSFDIEEAISI